MSRFVPGIAPEADPAPRALAFVGDALLVGDDGRATIAIDALGVAPPPERYVGTWDGRATYAVSLAEAPGFGRLSSVRSYLLAAPAEELGLVSAAAQIVRWDEDHRHCGRCGDALSSPGLRPGERAKRCARCDLSFYPRVSPCVIVLIHDGDRVLLGRRPGAPFHSLFAGFVEAGESLEEAAHRETREEVGVALDELAYFGSQTWPFPHQLMVGFTARWAGGEIVPDPGELAEAGWYPVDALPPIPPPLSIAHKLIVAHVAARLAARSVSPRG